MAGSNKTRLTGSTGNFDQMMRLGFGIVTVMDATVYKYEASIFSSTTAESAITTLGTSGKNFAT